MNISSPPFARAGSQRWLQVAVNRAPNLLLEVLRPALQLDSNVQIEWRSPLATDGFREYRDMAALRRLGIKSLPKRQLSDFWPRRGPVWNAIGNTSDGQLVFVEAKAHLGETVSPPSRATPASLAWIRRSLSEAQRHFAPDSQADWSGPFYQYANRLAHHYLFRTLNNLPSHMVFLYFVNATEMNGPKSKDGWQEARGRMHSALGLTQTDQQRTHEVFMDVSLLKL